MTMKKTWTAFAAACSTLALLGAANGAWLERVSATDHARVNPYSTEAQQQQAAAAGGQLFSNECAKCHGNDGLGKSGRPPVISDRIAHTTDGDLFWLMNNGVPWRGMPAWNMLPAKERWQLVTYLRALNGGASASPATSTSNPPAQN